MFGITWVAGLKEFVGDLLYRPPVLPGYRQESSALWKLVSKTLFHIAIVLVAAFYGLCVALLPPILLLYFSLPVLLIALLDLWALPDAARGPIRWVTLCFMAFTAVVALWPDYMAVQIPGFAWISFRRVWSWGLGVEMLLCLAMSSGIRSYLVERMRKTKPFWIMASIYFALQWVTLPLSAYPGSSFNISLNQVFVWWIPLVAATLLFDEIKNLRRWERVILFAAAVNCVIAVLEHYNRQILWVGHIPGFLTVHDEVLQRILAGVIRDGQYRATSVFTVSLCLAEFFAIAVPFTLYKTINKDSVAHFLFWALFDVSILSGILLTGSRLGVIGWIVSHGLFFYLWGIKRWMTKARDLAGATIRVFYPAAAAVFVLAMFTVPAVQKRTLGGGSTGLSDDSRKMQYQMFWPKFFHNPFGNGSGRNAEVLGYRTPGGMMTVDSYVISVGLDYGALGLICFFGMFFYTFWLATQTYLRSDSEEAELALPLACVIAALFFIRLVLSQEDNMPFIFILFGMSIALYTRTQSASDRKTSWGTGRPIGTAPRAKLGELQAAE